MTANAAHLDRAKDLVSEELPRSLGPRFEIHHIVADTFHHDEEDLVHIFVYLKPGHPDLDPHLLIRFDDEMHDRFVECGFTLPPAISYSDLQEKSLDRRRLAAALHTPPPTPLKWQDRINSAIESLHPTADNPQPTRANAHRAVSTAY